MKKLFAFAICYSSAFCFAQSLIQTVNSGGIALNANVSIGEILIQPATLSQSNSGLLGILIQVQQQTLEINSLKIDDGLVVYPNPTTSILNFSSTHDVAGRKLLIFDNSGKKVQEKILGADNTLDLTALAAGIYIIQFEDNQSKSFKIIKH